MKCLSTGVAAPGMRSRPARGAWIEIARTTPPGSAGRLSRPARGAWIEIISFLSLVRVPGGRAPHGARGLKCFMQEQRTTNMHVAPRTGRVD